MLSSMYSTKGFVKYFMYFLKFCKTPLILSCIYYLSTNLVILFQICKTFDRYRDYPKLCIIIAYVEEKYHKYWIDFLFLHGLGGVLNLKFRLNVFRVIITR